MKRSAIHRLAAARDENGARKCFTAPVRESVWQLAKDLESAHLWRSAALALELTRLAAETTGEKKIASEAAARAGFIASFSRYHFRGEVEPALEGLRASAEAFVSGGDSGRAIATLMAASRIALRNGRAEQCLAAASRALELLSSGNGSDESLLQVYLLAGDIFRFGAGPAHAVFFARASAVFKLRGEAQYSACAAALLGCTLVRNGDIESGLEMLADVDRTVGRAGIRRVDGSIGPVPEVFLAAYWTARGQALTGRLMEAERALRNHPWMDPQQGEPKQRDKLVSRIAEVLMELERYNDALELLNQRLSGGDGPSESGRALLLSEVAVLAALLGRPKLAANKTSEARELLADLASSDDMSLRARLHLLDASLIAHGSDAAALEPELAVIESESAAHPGEIMPFEFDRVRGDIALAGGEGQQAISQYRRALEGAWSAPADRAWAAHYRQPADWPADIEKTLHAGRTMARRKERGVGLRIQLGIARAKAFAGQDPALELDRVIEFASAANRASTLFYALHEKAKLALARRDPIASSLLERCIDILEGLRADIRDVSLQIGTLANKERVYADLLELTVAAPPRPELAMRVMERAKARGLLDQITAGRAEEAPGERDLAAYLRRKIVRLLRRQFAQGDQANLEIRRTKEQLGSVFQRQYSRLGTPVPSATPAEIVSFATANTAVLHYFIDSRGTFACVAAAGRMHAPVFLRDATPDSIAALLDSFAFELKSRQPPRSLEELYAILVEPLRADLEGASRLLVLPHRILHRVPFHALPSGDARYLAEDFVLSYAPSASFVLRSGGTVQRGTATTGPSVVVGVSRTTYLPLETLGDVQQEVTAVAERLGDHSVLQDDEAGRRSLLDLRGAIDVLHLACHGEFDEDDPLLSRLYLADGPVYAYELLGLAARPRLIVLSACESGVRAVEAGDESFGLIRPLLTTGSDAVLSSLWKISDRGAAAFMKVFYEQRRQFASDGPRCLAETQRALVRSVEYAHPYYWAPYMMVARRTDEVVR